MRDLGSPTQNPRRTSPFIVLVGKCIGIGGDHLIAAGTFCFIECHVRPPEKSVDGVVRFPFSNAKATRDGDGLLTCKDLQSLNAAPEFVSYIDSIGKSTFHQ